jgi:ADP-ribose pyrophosphatase
VKFPQARNPVIKIDCHDKFAFVQDFELPTGRVEEYFLFGSKSKPVIIFPMTRKMEVIAINGFRYGANSEILEIPGGNIEENKSPTETAKNELEEETGFSSDYIRQIGPKTWFDPASLRVTFIPMIALHCFKKGEPKHEPTEISEPVLIPFRKWLEKIKNKEICDAKTIAVTMMVLFDQYPDLMR